MLDILILIVFCWLAIKVLKLIIRIAWGLTKFIAAMLFVLALPLLAVCLIFAGGMALLVPLGMVALAFGLLKCCV